MKYDFENINLIADAIREPATASSYDWHMFCLGAVGILVSGIIAGAAAYYAYRLNQEQINIAERQSKIAEEQTEIARKQAEIMEQQNKIQLLKERFRVYKWYKQLYKNVGIVSITLPTQRQLKIMNKEVLIEILDEFLFKLIEPSNIELYPSEQSMRNKLNKFSELEESLDMIEYLFSLNNDSEKQLNDIRKAVKNFKNSILTLKDVLVVEKALTNLLDIMNNPTLKNTMKEHLYISKKGKQ